MKTKLKKTKMTKTKKMTKMRRIRMRKMVKIRRTRRKMELWQERRKRKSLAFVFFCERKREITKLETLQFVLLLAWQSPLLNHFHSIPFVLEWNAFDVVTHATTMKYKKETSISNDPLETVWLLKLEIRMRIVETLYYFIDVFMRRFMRGEVTDVVPIFCFVAYLVLQTVKCFQ